MEGSDCAPKSGPSREFPVGLHGPKKRESQKNRSENLRPNRKNHKDGGHSQPVTLKPVSRIFRISAFSCPHFPRFPLVCSVEPSGRFCRVRGAFRIFCILGSNR